MLLMSNLLNVLECNNYLYDYDKHGCEIHSGSCVSEQANRDSEKSCTSDNTTDFRGTGVRRDF